MIKVHADAILALLDTAEHITVYDAEVPNDPDLPYVVLWTTAPQRSTNRLSGGTTGAASNFQTTTVALDTAGLRIVQDHVHNALDGIRVEVPGYDTERVRHVNAEPIRPDYDVDPMVLYGVDQWQFVSIPA